MIVRVSHPSGTHRIEIESIETTNSLFEKILEKLSLNSFEFCLYKDQSKQIPIFASKSVTLNQVDLHHGDMIYLVFMTDMGENAFNYADKKIEEDNVDKILYSMDGTIERKKDDHYCQHTAQSKCIHCMPLEPYDALYLQEQNIKHMSFHAYLKKLMTGVSNGKFVALENISYKIKEGCKDHLPWPRGICSKCQPNAVMLNRQIYRHVDCIVFDNSDVVESFLNYWRLTGNQRLGFLYGYYEIHKDIPLGIKAVVAAIYEPPQESTRDSIILHKDDKEALVAKIASGLGIQKVGWIFTDLTAENKTKGTVKHSRNFESYFLSAQECIMAGYFQNAYPNPCHFSSSGYFGSKFVTVCVTGDSNSHIHIEGYQVSNQCMALVQDNILYPTKDAPELGYIMQSSSSQYVPDVFYKEKDSYNNEVIKIARPLPVEYLLVDVPVATPKDPKYFFTKEKGISSFPIENRMIDGHIQDFSVFISYLKQFSSSEFLKALNDFHLLLYLISCDILPLKNVIGKLLSALKNHDTTMEDEFVHSEEWSTVQELISASGSEFIAKSTDAAVKENYSNLWTCNHCTYLNNSSSYICEICALPKE